MVAGYRLNTRFGIEAALLLLPVATGFSYQRATPNAYIGFSSTYTNSYTYVPVRGLVRVLGAGHRLGLSALAGAGLAWTNLNEGLPITPNGTTAITVTNADGSTTASSYTEQITREKTHFAVLEAGLRGSWQVMPRLHLDLTVRQLWGLVESARDISLTISTPGEHLATTMTTPVRGVATGLGVHYAF